LFNDPVFGTALNYRVFTTPFTRYFIDVNGDGLPDSIETPADISDSCPPGTETFHESVLSVSMNIGGGFRPPKFTQQTTRTGFNPSLNRDDYRNPPGHPP